MYALSISSKIVIVKLLLIIFCTWMSGIGDRLFRWPSLPVTRIERVTPAFWSISPTHRQTFSYHPLNAFSFKDVQFFRQKWCNLGLLVLWWLGFCPIPRLETHIAPTYSLLDGNWGQHESREGGSAVRYRVKEGKWEYGSSRDVVSVLNVPVSGRSRDVFLEHLDLVRCREFEKMERLGLVSVLRAECLGLVT